MALNLFIRRASSSIIPLSIRYRRDSISGLQFLQSVRFSSTATNNNYALILESIVGGYEEGCHGDPRIKRPLEVLKYADSKLVLRRNFDHNKKTRVEVFEDTCKVIDGIPNVSIRAYVQSYWKDSARLEFKATAQPNAIRIHSLNINTRKGNLIGFHEHIGTRGIDARMIQDLFNFFRKQPEE